MPETHVILENFLSFADERLREADTGNKKQAAKLCGVKLKTSASVAQLSDEELNQSLLNATMLLSTVSVPPSETKKIGTSDLVFVKQRLRYSDNFDCWPSPVLLNNMWKKYIVEEIGKI